MSHRALGVVAGITAGVVGSGSAAGAVVPDNLVELAASEDATGGASLGSLTWDPATGSLWTVGYGSQGQIRRLAWDAAAGRFGSPETFATTTDVEFFFRSMNGYQSRPDWSGSFIIGGGRLNPAPLTLNGQTYGAGELLFITNGGLTVEEQPSEVERFDLTRKLFAYDLRKVGSATSTGPDRADASYYSVGTGGYVTTGQAGVADWNDVFTDLVVEQDLRDATGETGSDNWARQPVFSTDGQRLYHYDTGTSFGGVWRIDAATGAVTHLYDDDGETNSELAVVHTATHRFGPADAGDGDQVLFGGTAAHGNEGGISFLIDDGAVGGVSHAGVHTLVSGEALGAFVVTGGRESTERLELGTPDPGVGSRFTPRQTQAQSIVTDDAGNVYFFEDESQGVYMRDAEGHLYALKNKEQHLAWNAAGGSSSSNASSLRLQWGPDQTVDPDGVPASGDEFTRPTLLFQSVPLRAVGGIVVYKPGDFDRDNERTYNDVQSLKAALGTELVTLTEEVTSPSWRAGVTYWEEASDGQGGLLRETDPDAFLEYQKHDVDGNGLLTSHDVLGWSSALDILLGDIDLDGYVDLDDIDALFAHAFTEGVSVGWLDGDLNGDFSVDRLDYDLLAANWNAVSSLNDGLGLREGELPALIPEPATLALLLGAGVALVRRRERAC